MEAKKPMIARFALFVCIACFVSPALAVDETLSIPSRAISDEEFLRGDDTAADPITITGQLSGPDRDVASPVVILLHGTDGPRSGAAAGWRAFLNQSGVMTLRLDSYTGRGLTQASDDQGSFGQFAQIYDAYRAADVLAADSRIDGSRIVLMGFSRGGNSALYSAMTRFREAFGPKQAEIIGHLPFYPACNFALEGQLEVTDAPIRLFHGSEDDWTPIAPCLSYVGRLTDAGADAALTEYAGARHGFDNPGNPALYRDRNNQTSRNCLRREENGQLVNAATGEPFTYQDACVEYGPSSQYNDAAASAARAAVIAFLTEVFGTGTAQ